MYDYENMNMADELNDRFNILDNDQNFLNSYLDSPFVDNDDINLPFNMNFYNHTILRAIRNEDKSPEKKLKVKKSNRKVISHKSKENFDDNNISNSSNFANILSTNITSKVKKNVFITYKKKVHDKNYIDSIIKKIKTFIIKVLIIFVNEIIINERCKKDNSNNFLKEKSFRKIKKINPSIARNTNVEDNKKLLDTSIFDILTLNISEKYNLKSNYNKNLIKSYYQKYKVAEKFFDKKFVDIFNYINDEDKKDKIFEGFEKIYENNLKSKKVDDKNIIIKNVKNFVKIINNRKSR